MKLMRLLIIILSIILFSSPASSEFYRYIDEQGKVRYTDNIANIPKDQREGVRKYTEYQSEPEQKPDEERKESKESTPEEKQAQGQPTVNPEEQKNLQEIKAKLDKQKLELEQEYNAIMAEKKLIDQERENATTPDKIKEYNQNVIKLNDRIDQYETKQKKYNEEVQAYNNRLKELMGEKKIKSD